MGTSSPTDAVVVPQSKGTGIASEDDIVSAASASLLASHEQGEYRKAGLDFANVDTANEQVDVTSGVCYIVDTSTSTTSSRGAGGNASMQSTSSSGYDTEIPDEQVYVVILPTDVVDLGLDADVENDIYISVDVTTQNSVTVHGTSGAAPSNPHLKIGTVNSSDGSTTRAADNPDLTLNGLDVAAETAVRAYRSSSLSLSAGSYSTVVFDTEQEDDLNEYDPSNGQFVPSETGYYLISPHVTFGVGADQDLLSLRLRDTTNATTVSVTTYSASGTDTVAIAPAIQKELTSGVTYEVQARNNNSSDSIPGTDQQTYLGIRRLFT